MGSSLRPPPPPDAALPPQFRRRSDAASDAQVQVLLCRRRRPTAALLGLVLPLPQAPRRQPRHLHVQRGHAVLQRGMPAGADRDGRGRGAEQKTLSQSFLHDGLEQGRRRHRLLKVSRGPRKDRHRRGCRLRTNHIHHTTRFIVRKKSNSECCA